MKILGCSFKVSIKFFRLLYKVDFLLRVALFVLTLLHLNSGFGAKEINGKG